MEVTLAHLDRTVIIIVILLSSVIGFFLILHTVEPESNVDATTLGLLGLLIAVWCLPLAKSVTLPGGAKIDLRDSSLKVAIDSRRSLEVTQPTIRTAGTNLENTWQRLLSSDRNLALAGLRIEIERLLREMGKRTGLSDDRIAMGSLVARLAESGTLSDSEQRLIQSVLSVCNRAVHGANVTPEAAALTADLGDTVVRILRMKGG